MQQTQSNASERTRSYSSAKVAALMIVIELGEAIREELDTVVSPDGRIIFNVYGGTVTLHVHQTAPAEKGGES